MTELEKHVSEIIKQLVPNYEKLDVRANIGDKTYSIEFFVTINGQKMQCYDMADNGIIEESELNAAFKSIASYIRTAKEYTAGTINKFSFSVSK